MSDYSPVGVHVLYLVCESPVARKGGSAGTPHVKWDVSQRLTMLMGREGVKDPRNKMAAYLGRIGGRQRNKGLRYDSVEIRKRG